MPGYVKLEKFRIIERRNGTIYKTQSLGFEWFPINRQPEPIDGDIMWIRTLDYHFGSEATLPKE